MKKLNFLLMLFMGMFLIQSVSAVETLRASLGNSLIDGNQNNFGASDVFTFVKFNVTSSTYMLSKIEFYSPEITLTGANATIMIFNRSGDTIGTQIGTNSSSKDSWTTTSLNFTFSSGRPTLVPGDYYLVFAINGTSQGYFRAGETLTGSSESLWGSKSSVSGTPSFSLPTVDSLNIKLYSDSANTIDVSLISPTDNFRNTSSTWVFNSTLVPTNVNLTNATIFVWYSNGSLLNSTTNLVIGSVANTSRYTLFNVPFGTFIWNVLAKGINSTGATVSNFAPTNFTFIRQQFTLSNENHPNQTQDTDNNNFTIDITIANSTELFSAILVYEINSSTNKTKQATLTDIGGGNVRALANIDIPKVNTTNVRNFTWRFTFDDGSGFTTLTSDKYSQTITPTNINTTSSLAWINFTIFDEDTLLSRVVFFDGTFDWFLGLGTETKQRNHTRPSSNQFPFYTSNSTRTFFTDSKIQLRNNSGSQDDIQRNFDFRLDQINNLTLERQLLVPNLTRTTNVRIEVKDAGLQPLEEVYVTIERYYPGDDKYRMVENRKTDLYGQFVARLIENDIRYRAFIRDANLTLLKATGDFTLSCNTAICFLPFVIEDQGGELEPFENLTNYIITLGFNNDTNRFRFTWDDNTEQSPIHRLQVTRRLLNGTNIVCNVTSNSLQGVLNCDVGSSRASYDAQAFRRVGNREVRVASMTYKVGDLSQIFGMEGLFWGFILLFTLIGFGIIAHPIVGVVLYMVGFMFLGLFDIIFVDPAILIANLVLGVAFIWAFRG